MNILSVNNPEEIAKELKTISLRYVSDTSPGIIRQKRGKGFVYLKNNEIITDPNVKKRIDNLVIPPAWKDVWISPTDNGHIQATGRDEKGRKQYIYHTAWNKLMQQNKFNKMIFFGDVLPEIRREILAGMNERGLTQRRIITTIIWLVGKTYIRIGNEEYAAENQSYGLTTMRMKHVDVKGDTIHFDFKGKSGKFHSVEVEHPQVAKTIKRLEELPGYELFQYVDSEGERHTVTSDEINEYLQKLTGEEITAKDFRTWGGTVYAAKSLYDDGLFHNRKEARKNIAKAIKQVSMHLGNTTAVCRAYYIHPTVIKTYEKKELIPYFAACKNDYTTGKGLSLNEYSVHRLIKKYAKPQ